MMDFLNSVNWFHFNVIVMGWIAILELKAINENGKGK